MLTKSLLNVLFFGKDRQGLHTSHLVHQAGTYPGFCSIREIRVFVPPLDWILVLPQHLIRRYPVVHEGSGTLRVKCLAQEQHNWPGLKQPTAQFEATVPLRTPT